MESPQQNHNNKGIIIAVLCLIIGVVLGSVLVSSKAPTGTQQGASLDAKYAEESLEANRAQNVNIQNPNEPDYYIYMCANMGGVYYVDNPFTDPQSYSGTTEEGINFVCNLQVARHAITPANTVIVDGGQDEKIASSPQELLLADYVKKFIGKLNVNTSSSDGVKYRCTTDNASIVNTMRFPGKYPESYSSKIGGNIWNCAMLDN